MRRIRARSQGSKQGSKQESKKAPQAEDVSKARQAEDVSLVSWCDWQQLRLSLQLIASGRLACYRFSLWLPAALRGFSPGLPLGLNPASPLAYSFTGGNIPSS